MLLTSVSPALSTSILGLASMTDKILEQPNSAWKNYEQVQSTFNIHKIWKSIDKCLTLYKSPISGKECPKIDVEQASVKISLKIMIDKFDFEE